ncbi:hypothetical protein CC78DRAFT_607068 [Lojkania enalia]|uniref:Rhodopsin domain-containing protein n=1 Tax=Lojkania enalia TaxID=147567 RepID=A0A9P4K3H3_9PLEO|nr:hypothetical protein CC78DRAFT_607068 [Didymosphaeria enalia]
MSAAEFDLTHASPELLALLASTPVMTPPKGVTPNFVNPESRAHIQIKVLSVVLTFTIMFFCNRFYVKVWLMKKVTWDDGTLLLSMIGALAYYVTCIWGSRHGLGIHQWNLSMIQAMDDGLMIPTYLVTFLTPLVFLFLKMSFFILYLQLFSQEHKIRIVCWIGLVATAVTYTIISILVGVFATPGKGETWFSHQTSENMKRDLAMSVPQSIIGLVFDLIILAVPIFAVSGLTMSLKRKIGVLLIFLSGTMACVCSACNIYFRHVLDHSEDKSYYSIPVTITTLCEMFVGIIVACMPSAAYSTRKHLPAAQNLMGSLSIRFRTWKLTVLGSQSSLTRSQTTTETSHLEPDVLKSTDRKYAQYYNMIDLNTMNSTITSQAGDKKETTDSPLSSVLHATSNCDLEKGERC